MDYGGSHLLRTWNTPPAHQVLNQTPRPVSSPSFEQPRHFSRKRPFAASAIGSDLTTRCCPEVCQTDHRSPGSLGKCVCLLRSSATSLRSDHNNVTHLLLDCITILPLTLARCLSVWVFIVHATRHPCDVSASVPTGFLVAS